MVKKVKKDRLLSLDFLRGLVIILMIIVNSAGSETYSFLKHSAWNGWTLADAVFPFFLWIMGVSMVFSFAKRMKKGESKKQIMLHVVKRSVILFLIGFLFNLFYSFSFVNFRILGVLQLIALTYFFAGIIVLFTKPKTQIILVIILLLTSGLLLKFVTVPGQEIGVLEPGKNLANYIDIRVLKGHMSNEKYDPEGLFSCFSAIATVLFGAFAGNFLTSKRKDVNKIKGIGLLGILLVLIGSISNIWLPINKNLWTSSFSIFMSGLASVLFVISYWVIDFKKYQKFTFPFVVFGLNALSLYIASGVIYGLSLIKFYKGMNLYLFFYERIYSQILPLKEASLLIAITQVLMVYFIAYFMYKKNIFLKI